MPKFFKLATVLSFILLFSFQTIVFANSGDMSINEKDIRFSTNTFLEGHPIRIYASVTNLSNDDVLGTVRFYDNDTQIGGDQAVSVLVGRTDDVFMNWTPGPGNHKIAVKVFPWDGKQDNPGNNWISKEIFVVQDTDYDGTPNSHDPDDDNDGVPDTEDQYPLDKNEQKDTDGDGKGDNKDPDDDNDGVPDEFDDLPKDPNESIDTDKDGIGNIKDPDDDNDSISDINEENAKTDPLKVDTDSDKVNDNKDPFPLNSEENTDTDKDNIGNNADPDDDNDSIKDGEDAFPLNKGPILELEEEKENIEINEEQEFNASPSYDQDGQIVSYVWEIDDQLTKEGNAIKHRFDKPGFHKLKLTVTDDHGESITKTFQLNVTNLRIYKQLFASLITILLAMFIYFKYISAANGAKAQREDAERTD